jgi:hypothetical protein
MSVEMTTKTLWPVLLIVMLMLIIAPLKVVAEEPSECINCHTTGRMLVQITREIAKSRPAPQVSTESVGEG